MNEWITRSRIYWYSASFCLDSIVADKTILKIMESIWIWVDLLQESNAQRLRAKCYKISKKKSTLHLILDKNGKRTSTCLSTRPFDFSYPKNIMLMMYKVDFTPIFGVEKKLRVSFILAIA